MTELGYVGSLNSLDVICVHIHLSVDRGSQGRERDLGNREKIVEQGEKARNRERERERDRQTERGKVMRR